MLLQWVFFVVSVVVAYTGISWFGQMTAEFGTTPVTSFLAAIRPVPLFIVTVANMFFGLGLYYGFGLTRFALPATIALGVITSFVFSAVVLGAQVTLMKLVGVLVVILGVVILAL